MNYPNNLFVEFRVGRPRTCKTPQDLLKKFQDYTADRMAKPLIIAEEETASFTGSGGARNGSSRERRKDVPHPLSIADFCIYMGRNRDWWNKLPEEFFGVKKGISDYIEQYQLKGAQAGMFNANIVSRLLGLVDKKEVVGDAINIIVRSKEEKDKIDNIGGLGV